jgi:hypothetical protein
MITKVVIVAGGQEKPLTVKEWLALPLTERVGHISAGTVQFFNGATKLSSRDALTALKTMS